MTEPLHYIKVKEVGVPGYQYVAPDGNLTRSKLRAGGAPLGECLTWVNNQSPEQYPWVKAVRIVDNLGRTVREWDCEDLA